MSLTTVPRRLIGAAASLLLMAAVGALTPAGAQEQREPPEEVVPGLPVRKDPELGVVHSWALAPAGAGDGSQAGDRANLTYEMAPGTIVSDRVTLFNLSNVPLEFELFPADAKNTDDGAFAPRSREDTQTGVGAWVRLPVDRMTVPNRQSATFDIVVNVPPDTEPGDYAGAILASNDARGTSPDGRIITLDRQTGTRVYIRVAGELKPELAVAGLNTHYTPTANPLGGTAEITYRVENRGNVRLTGTHRVSVGGPFGLLKKSGPAHELPDLLPGESLEFTETIDGVAATVAAFTTVDLAPVVVDGSNEKVEADDSRAIGLALPVLPVALALAALFMWIARSRYRKRLSPQARPRGELIEREHEPV